MNTNRRTWQRPELVVISRSKTEETVLAACKTEALNQFGPSSTKKKCANWPATCHTNVAS